MSKRLADLSARIPHLLVPELPEIEITGITQDSRAVRPGTLFVARQGSVVDGKRFVEQAIQAGAAAILADGPLAQPPSVPCLIATESFPSVLAEIAHRFTDYPFRSMTMLGITGTNGKTTTSYLLRSILRAAGRKVGLVGTIAHWIGDLSVNAANTTPEVLELDLLLREMVDAGCDACVAEVSSHALALDRVHGIPWAAAAFGNLTVDHLDFHGDLESYFRAKALLFQGLELTAKAVIRVDDEYGRRMLLQTQAGVWSVSLDHPADLYPLKVVLERDGSHGVLATPAGEVPFQLHLPGRYNLSNALLAAGMALSVGVDPVSVAMGLNDLHAVPGRTERIERGQPFTVVVDYAHTPDALERVLIALRELSYRRIIVVFGCGGDRDHGKRPQMAAVVAKYANQVLATSDNPRTEDPESILDMVTAGFPKGFNYVRQIDRAEAIREAIGLAEAGDCVLIAGKGHENYQIIGREKRHFDDGEVARTALESRGYRYGA